jgi:hypothetical protein
MDVLSLFGTLRVWSLPTGDCADLEFATLGHKTDFLTPLDLEFGIFDTLGTRGICSLAMLELKMVVLTPLDLEFGNVGTRNGRFGTFGFGV